MRFEEEGSRPPRTVLGPHQERCRSALGTQGRPLAPTQPGYLGHPQSASQRSAPCTGRGHGEGRGPLLAVRVHWYQCQHSPAARCNPTPGAQCQVSAPPALPQPQARQLTVPVDRVPVRKAGDPKEGGDVSWQLAGWGEASHSLQRAGLHPHHGGPPVGMPPQAEWASWARKEVCVLLEA